MKMSGGERMGGPEGAPFPPHQALWAEFLEQSQCSGHFLKSKDDCRANYILLIHLLLFVK